MRRYLILACLALATVNADAAQDAGQPALPPLTDIIDASREHLDTTRFIGQFNSLCRGYGKEALDQALAPFKDPRLLNRATANAQYDGGGDGEIYFFLARAFWKGMCVEKDEAAAYAVMTDQAFRLGLSTTTGAWKRRKEVIDFIDKRSRRYARPEDYADRSLTEWDVPPWTERMIPIANKAKSFIPASLQLDSQPGEAALAAVDDFHGYGRSYGDIPPVRQEIARAIQLTELGYDGPVSVALTLRQSETVLAGQNHLAVKWLETAAQGYFEHPYAIHFQALWRRDRVLAALLAKEGDERIRNEDIFSHTWTNIYASNYALGRALEVGDTSLLPLAYCLMDYQLWDQSADSNLRRVGERYNNMFQGGDDRRAERLAFQYEAMLLMEDQGQKLPVDELEKVSREISFLKRMSIRMVRHMSGLDLDPELLPQDTIDLTACAEKTGQTDFWQEMGLIEAPERYWLGKDVAEAPFKTDRINGLVPLEQLFNLSRYTADWSTLIYQMQDYCDTYDPITMDRYLAPFKYPERWARPIDPDKDAGTTGETVRAFLAGVYAQGTCVPRDMEFARSVGLNIDRSD